MLILKPDDQAIKVCMLDYPFQATKNLHLSVNPQYQSLAMKTTDIPSKRIGFHCSGHFGNNIRKNGIQLKFRLRKPIRENKGYYRTEKLWVIEKI